MEGFAGLLWIRKEAGELFRKISRSIHTKVRKCPWMTPRGRIRKSATRGVRRFWPCKLYFLDFFVAHKWRMLIGGGWGSVVFGSKILTRLLMNVCVWVWGDSRSTLTRNRYQASSRKRRKQFRFLVIFWREPGCSKVSLFDHPAFCRWTGLGWHSKFSFVQPSQKNWDFAKAFRRKNQYFYANVQPIKTRNSWKQSTSAWVGDKKTARNSLKLTNSLPKTADV